PLSMIAYLRVYWLEEKVKKYWSAIYHQEWTILEECDTNMLVEAWHHLLKGHFAEGKRNQCLDHLIHVLVVVAMRHFIYWHQRQALGLDGLNLEAQAWKDV
ncbi:hypothetical protein ARMGADRAFT_855271, partial [Armillaria gallica]